MNKKPKRSHRPRYGEGSFAYNASMRLWRGCIDLGTDANGKRVRAWVSSRDEDEAWRRFQEARTKLATEGPAALLPQTVTVEEWAHEWVEIQKRRTRAKGWKNRWSSLKNWVIPTIGSKRLIDLTARDLRTIEDAVAAAGRKSSTATYAQSTLQTMCREAQREGLKVGEGVLVARKAAKSVPEREPMTPQQALAMLEVASKRPDGSQWLAALLNGLRAAERRGLRWDHVDLDRPIGEGVMDISWQLQNVPYKDRAAGTFHIPEDVPAIRLEGAYHLIPPKTNRGQRIIPIVPALHLALLEWRERAYPSPYGLVWPRPNGKPMAKTTDTRVWQALQDEAGVRKPNGEYFTIHEARNTAATLLLEANADSMAMTAIMGHTDIATTRGYQRASQRLTREALDRVVEILQIED